METGIVTETEISERQAKQKSKHLFLQCAPTVVKLSTPLQSRFFIVELESYTYEQFYGIIFRLLDAEEEIALIIVDLNWEISKIGSGC